MLTQTFFLKFVSVFFAVRAAAVPSPASYGRRKQQSGCAPFSGTFSIDNYQLYPENLDFDSKHCKLYLGALFNSTVLVYDPYTKSSEIITFPGISGKAEYHVSGVSYDSRHDAMYISANAAAPFVTNGKDLTGPNKLIKLDTNTNSVVWTADMAAFQADVQTRFGKFASGFQDQDQDSMGNVYGVVGWGNSIVKITPQGDVSAWYVQPGNNTARGFGSIAAAGNTIVVVDDSTNTLYNFDATVAKDPTPSEIKVANLPAGFKVACDGIIMPPKYNSQIMLCSDDELTSTGGIVILKSTDGWKSAQYLGQVLNDDPLAKGSLPTASVQIADSIFISPEFFMDSGSFDVAGTRASFPFIDITAKVDGFVSG